jgi:hypothetical protein
MVKELPSLISLSPAALAKGGDTDMSVPVCCFDEGEEEAGPAVETCMGKIPSSSWCSPNMTGFQLRPISISSLKPLLLLFATLLLFPVPFTNLFPFPAYAIPFAHLVALSFSPTFLNSCCNEEGTQRTSLNDRASLSTEHPQTNE